ncbi:MAG: hypothetical protein ACOYLS_01325 [Polymorphobacter sp.]
MMIDGGDDDAGAGGGGGGGGGGFDAGLLTGEAAGGAATGGDDAGKAGDGDAAKDGDGAAGDPWFAGLSDEAADDKTLSDRKWAENKKYPDMPALVKAMRGLESQLGGEKLPLPKGPEDKDGWDRLFKAAGRPDAPEGYKFDAIATADPALVGAFAPVAHQLGLSQAQAEGVAKFNEAMVAEQAKAMATAHAGEVAAMKAEAGTEFPAMLERSLRAAERFGLDGGDVAKLRETIGPQKLIGMLNKIGQAMGEDGIVGGGRQALGMTAEKAATRKAEILNDPAFQQRLQKNEATALAEWKAINAAMAAAAERQQAA